MAWYRGIAISTLCVAIVIPNHSSARDNGEVPIPRSSNGSTSSRVAKACAARLPMASVCGMWTGTHRTATIVCAFRMNGLLYLTLPL
jgi:hypothetical protein